MATWILTGSEDDYVTPDGRSEQLIELWRRADGEELTAVGDCVYLWAAGVHEGIMDAAAVTKTGTPDRSGILVPGLRMQTAAPRDGYLKAPDLAEDPICTDLRPLASGKLARVSDLHAARLAALWSRLNRPWSYAEDVAALLAYHRTYRKPLSKRPHQPVWEVSALVGRTLGSAYSKVLNYRHIDPREVVREGRSGVGAMDRIVFARFYDEATQAPKLGALETEFLFRHGPESVEIEARKLSNLSMLELLRRYASGTGQVTALSVQMQRDPTVVAIARKRAGDRCEVPACPFELFVTGSGRPFTEVHYIVPLEDW